MNINTLVLTLLSIIVAANCVQYAVVIKQNINLRNAKVDFPTPVNFARLDGGQETQLLFQECVTVETIYDDGWMYITIPNQQTFDFPVNNTVVLHNYPGYIRSNEVFLLPSDATTCPALHARRRVIVTDNLVPLYNEQRNLIISRLSIGTTLEEIISFGGWTTVRVFNASGAIVNGLVPTAFVTKRLTPLEQLLTPLILKQRALIEYGQRYMGWKYAWGGRSSLDLTVANTTFSGVDCSGFTNLVYYMAAGIELPRNSHDQYLVARNITRRQTDDFRVGDLLFLGRTDRLRMSHVMIYIGDGMVMESAGTVGSRIFSVAEKLGVNSIADLYYEGTVIDRGTAKRFYWGRVF
jgi:hypothetical protein